MSVVESWPMRRILPIALALVCLLATSALAHIQLTYPLQRYTEQKNPPCGRTADLGRGETITVLEPGSTITVTWDETVNHPGHFRIAFDEDGQDDFYDPPTMETCDTGAPILVDCIADLPTGGAASFDITLPDIECDNCTLQVIQVMYDKPPFGDGNDMYYQCADLTLRQGAGGGDGGPGGPDAGSPGPDAGTAIDDGAGCCQTSSGPRSGTLLLGLAIAGLLYRRRRRGR